jgi:hypothetical protein
MPFLCLSVDRNVVALGGLVAIELPTGPKVRGFNPGRDDGFLRAIKIRSTTSFGGEVKPSVPCRKILRHVKHPCSMKEILRKQNSRAFIAVSLSCFATKRLYWLLPESSGGLIRSV